MSRPARPIKLYRHPLSGHCHRVELFLSLLDLPYEHVEVDLVGKAQRRPEFLALNAFGQVPVIDDDGTIVADSNAILTYLALRYGEPHWLPRDALGAARVQRWLSIAAGPLAYSAARARAARVFGRGDDMQAEVQAAQALFSVLDATLAGGTPYLAGEQPTIADLALYAYTARAPEGGVALDPYPAVRGWLQRIEGMPRFVPMPVTRVGLAA